MEVLPQVSGCFVWSVCRLMHDMLYQYVINIILYPRYYCCSMRDGAGFFPFFVVYVINTRGMSIR